MMSGPGQRFVLIDGLRGLAALWVACFHIYPASHAALPSPLDGLIRQGDLGVPVFFVLSGFAIAWSLRGVEFDLFQVGRFMLRRSIRLEPAYWVSIAVAGALTGAPSAWSVLLHVLYLPHIVGVAAIQGPYWSLFLEIQFYLFFVVLLWWAPRARVAALVASACISMLLGFIVHESWHGLGISKWFGFALGVLVAWRHDQQISLKWLWASLGLLAIVALKTQDEFSAVVGLVTLGLILASERHRLDQWLGGRICQFLGKISYSLYLLHFVVGPRAAEFAHSRGWISPFLCGVAASIAAAFVMWWAVERPTTALARGVKLKAQ
jgi:peptidoglycan/LPS O-acetylase OafA/YrhL